MTDSGPRSARCPDCRRDLDQFEVFRGIVDGEQTWRYECECGARVTATRVGTGFVMSRDV